MDASMTARDQSSAWPSSKLRPLVLAVSIVALFGLGLWLKHTGVLTQESISAWVRGFGIWSAPIFLLAFTAGVLLNLPGLLFVVVARVAFGPVAGLLLGYAGAVLGVSAPF